MTGAFSADFSWSRIVNPMTLNGRCGVPATAIVSPRGVIAVVEHGSSNVVSVRFDSFSKSHLAIVFAELLFGVGSIKWRFCSKLPRRASQAKDDAVVRETQPISGSTVKGPISESLADTGNSHVFRYRILRAGFPYVLAESSIRRRERAK
jgi:hypothetical protein